MMTAEQFKMWRERLGLSLTGAAERLGVSRRAVQFYQSGERPISKTVALACAALEAGLDTEDLGAGRFTA